MQWRSDKKLLKCSHSLCNAKDILAQMAEQLK